MELRILGCSGGEAEGERLTGLLVNGCLAIDAGSLTQALTVVEQIAVRHIFLTHSHLDHMCTLPFYTKNIFGHTTSPVGIRALPETWTRCAGTSSTMSCGPDFSVIPRPDDPTIVCTKSRPERCYELDGLRIADHLVLRRLQGGGRPQRLHLHRRHRRDGPDPTEWARDAQLERRHGGQLPQRAGWLAEASKHLTPRRWDVSSRSRRPARAGRRACRRGSP